MSWGFWEIINDDARIALIKFQWENYGTKLDEPLQEFTQRRKVTVHYPDEGESDRDMRRVEGEISPVRTRGI